MAMVAEMVAMAVVKVLINYYLQKHLENTKTLIVIDEGLFYGFHKGNLFF